MIEQIENNTIIDLVVPGEYELERLDHFLMKSLEVDFSRSYVQKLIKQGHILINGGQTRQNYKVKEGDTLHITVPEPEKLELIPRDIPIDIVYEDDSLAVIYKPPGLVVHPGPGNWDNTLVNALLFQLSGLSSIGGVERPGIVHRLDKDTSGLMIIAKNDKAHDHFSQAFANRTIFKRYIAVVAGNPKSNHDTLEFPIERHKVYRHKMTVSDTGRDAKTEYRVMEKWNTPEGIFALLDIILHTGRTHQIRVHFSSQGMAIVGDPIYSKKWKKHRVPFLLLAAVELGFKHPVTGEDMTFKAEMPEHFHGFIDRLGKRQAVK